MAEYLKAVDPEGETINIKKRLAAEMASVVLFRKLLSRGEL